MSSVLLYHTLQVRGYRLVRVERDEDATLLHVEPQPHRVCCAQCHSRNVIHRGQKERWLRGLPVGRHMTWLIVKLPRVECRTCGAIRQIVHGLAEPKRTYTHAFARYVLELSRYMTILDVARHLYVSWDIVKEIQRRHLQRRYAAPPLADVRQIAIDEICIGAGHRYLTVVLDLESGAVLFVGEGKKAAVLDPFWRRLRAAHARVEAVAIDMSRAYIQAVETHLPRATIVFDRFHIVKLMNEKLTQLRRELFHEAATHRQRQVLKGTRWLLLKHPEHLDLKRNEYQRLQAALKLNEPLALAYYLKEDLRQVWQQPTKADARRVLVSWYQQALGSGIRVLADMARTLLAHQHGILAWYDYPISTSPLEGTNNKIKTLQRQAYGYRDPEFLKLKLYALHETKYALVG